MGKRNNNGYIGFNTDDFLQGGGMIDREKNYQTRTTYNNENFSIYPNLLSTPPFPTGSISANLIPSSSGTGSIATVGLVSGSIAALQLYAGGTGYGTNVTLSFSGGNGTGANGYVSTLSAGVITAVERLGVIRDYIITNGGSGYSSAPTVTVSAPVSANGKTGVTAIVSASITNGVVTSLTIHNTGSNYRGSANYPTLTFSGGTPTVTAQAVPILEFGRDYTSPPTVTVTGAGSGGIVSASIYGKLPTTASIISGGDGYTYGPSVLIAGAYNFDTSASSTLTGNAVSSISIQTGSSTFNTPPTMSVTGLPDLPAVSNNQIVMWAAVYNNNSNWNGLTITTNGGGGYAVDWGDGTSGSFNSNVTASKQYTTASFNALTSSIYNGYKPVLITVNLSGSATSFATVDFRTRPALSTGSYATAINTNNYVDIKMAGDQITALNVGANQTQFNSNFLLERFEFSGSNRITSFSDGSNNGMFHNCYNLKEITSLYTLSGSIFINMFNNCFNLTNIPEFDFTGVGASSVSIGFMFLNCSGLQTVRFKNTSKLTSFASTFSGCSSLQKIVTDSNMFPSSATDYGNTFNLCVNLTEVPSINATSVISFSSTFNNCRNLKYVKIIGNTRNVTIFSNMFNGCSSLIYVDGTINAIGATSFASMFSNCTSLTRLPKIINTRGITTIDSMFAGCSALRSVPLFDTQNVTTFSSTFNNCSSLRTIPKYNTSKVTTMVSTFNGCLSLVYIPLLDTSNVTDMSSMFQNCRPLVTIPPLNTTKVNTMASMFSGCTSLQTIPYIDTQNVTTMANMFQNCSSLTEIPLLNTANVVTMTNTFTSCTNLRYIPALNLSNLTSAASLFSGCSSIKELPYLNFNRLTTGTSLFSSCINLSKVRQIDISRHTDYSNMFNGCSSLIEIGPLFFTGSSTATYTNIFTSCPTLRRIQMFNVANNITIPQGLVSANELNEIYTNLATVGIAGSNAKTITVTNNWGTVNDNITIAQNKGWQVTG